jgi:uncharacterized protein (DUF2267 family)
MSTRSTLDISDAARTFAERTGTSVSDGRRILRATARSLGAHLSAGQRSWLGRALPRGLSDAIEAPAAGHAPFEWDGVYRRMSELTGDNPARAAEMCQVACQTLVDALPPETRAALPDALPPELLDRLETPQTRRRREPSRPSRGTGTTLAGGRPGSRSPLSEASPAHAESVVASPNPHGDRKISSSTGSQRTLARGRPGSSRPISEAGQT